MSYGTKCSIIATLAFGAIAITGCSDDNDDVVVSADQLPQTAQQFVKQYFGGDRIRKVTKDTEYAGAEFEVQFASGTEVEFDHSGQWVDVDAPKGKSIPGGIAPAETEKYISSYYPGAGINEISRGVYGYEVELTTGHELIFAYDGSFLSMDY